MISPYATCFEAWNVGQAIPYTPPYGTARLGPNEASFLYQSDGCGFFEHFLHHFAVGSAAHGVGDDLAVEQVQDWREVQFAVLPFEFGNVGQPFFVGLSGFEPAFEEVFRYLAHGGMAVGFFRPYEGFQFQLLHQPRHFFAVPI